MTIGERIKLSRIVQRRNQIELAQSAGIAVNSLRLYEANKREPRLKQLIKIAQAVDLPLSFFISAPPFEDLELLYQFKGVLLSALEEKGLFVRNDRPLVNIGDFEYWKCVGQHIISVVRSNDNSLNVQYKTEITSESQNVEFSRFEVTFDFSEIIEKFSTAGTETVIQIYPLLRNLTHLNLEGIKEAYRLISDLLLNKDYRNNSAPTSFDGVNVDFIDDVLYIPPNFLDSVIPQSETEEHNG